MQTQIRLHIEVQSEQGLHCLCLFEALSYGETCFKTSKTVNKLIFKVIYFLVFLFMDIFERFILFSGIAELDYARIMYRMAILTFSRIALSHENKSLVKINLFTVFSLSKQFWKIMLSEV